MINTLIFDLDGTLFHSAPGIATAFNQLMAAHGEPAVEESVIISYIGNGVLDLLKKLNSRLANSLGEINQLEAEFHTYYKKIFLEQSYLYPGVVDFLNSWHGHLALVSNKSEHYVHELIYKTPLKRYKWSKIIGGNTYSVKKPNPFVIHEVIKENNVRPENCLIVGDGLPDIQVALNAGIRSVAVDFGYHPISELIQHGAHARISSFVDLPKVISVMS